MQEENLLTYIKNWHTHRTENDPEFFRLFRYFSRTFPQDLVVEERLEGSQKHYAVSLNELYTYRDLFDVSISDEILIITGDTYNCLYTPTYVYLTRYDKYFGMMSAFLEKIIYSKDIVKATTLKTDPFASVSKNCITFSQNISGWDVSKVTTTSSMFKGS